MFRRLVSNSLRTQTNRWQDISRFACLRASLNGSYTTAFNELAAKNNVTPQELTQLSLILNLNLNQLEENIHPNFLLVEREASLRYYRESSVGTRGNLQDVRDAIVARYPNLGTQIGQLAGYKEAYEALQKIFINPAVKVNTLNERFSTDFKQRADEVVAQLLKENKNNAQAVQTVNQIQSALNTIIDNFVQHPSSTYSRLLTVLQVKGYNTVPVQQGETPAKEVVAANQSAVPSLRSQKANVPLVENVSASQVFNAERAFIKEANSILQSNVGNLPWDGTRKKIFQGSAQSVAEVPYYLVALLSGVAVAYFLYSGDAKYKTLLLTPVVGLGALALFKRHQIINRVPTLTELFLHKDGKHVDAVIAFNGQYVSKNDIPVSTLKLNRGDHNITVDLTQVKNQSIAAQVQELAGAQSVTINYSQIRNLAGSRGQVLNLGDSEVLVPFQGQGNRLILKQILKGVEVLPSV